VVFAGDFDSNAVGEEVIKGGIDELGQALLPLLLTIGLGDSELMLDKGECP
jgi:hypothetical protein